MSPEGTPHTVVSVLLGRDTVPNANYICQNLIQMSRLAHLLPIMLFFFPTDAESQKSIYETFDWQGHRGCRGLLPENTVPAFLKALEFPVKTLELDLAVSKDGKLIVSHEPWFSSEICSHPDGTPVKKSEEKQLNIHQMTLEEIQRFDCGRRGNSRFPEQQAMAAHKPTLEEVVMAVRQWCFENNRFLPHFNIEIKSKPQWDGIFSPGPEEFAKLVLEAIERLKLKDHVIVQSFDVRPLQALHHLDPSIPIALLVENLDSLENNIAKLGFKPQVYSPYYVLLRKKHIRRLHKEGIAVIPWTVNSVKTMKLLRKKGVDGIITDYPNLIEQVEKD